jgi:hypothetical protein
MKLTYKEKWLGNMSAQQMRQFIIWQNLYDYDGRQIWHSKEALARFCDLPESHPKYKTFKRVYDRVTKEFNKEAA